MTDFLRRLRSFGLVLAVSLGAASALAQLQIRGASSPTPQVVVRAPSYSGDYIVAVVNSELVTAAEVEQRIERMRMAGAPRGGLHPGGAGLAGAGGHFRARSSSICLSAWRRILPDGVSGRASTNST